MIELFSYRRQTPGTAGWPERHLAAKRFWKRRYYVSENHQTGSIKNKVTIVFDGSKPEGFINRHPDFTFRFSGGKIANEEIKKIVKCQKNKGNSRDRRGTASACNSFWRKSSKKSGIHITNEETKNSCNE